MYLQGLGLRQSLELDWHCGWDCRCGMGNGAAAGAVAVVVAVALVVAVVVVVDLSVAGLWLKCYGCDSG